MEACRNPAMRLWIDDSEAGNKNRIESTAPPSPIGRHHWCSPARPAAMRPIITPKRALDDNMDDKLFLATATFDVFAVDKMFLRKPDDSDEHERAEKGCPGELPRLSWRKLRMVAITVRGGR